VPWLFLSALFSYTKVVSSYNPRHLAGSEVLTLSQISEYRTRLALYRCPEHQVAIDFGWVSPSGRLDLVTELCCKAPEAAIDAAFRAACNS